MSFNKHDMILCQEPEAVIDTRVKIHEKGKGFCGSMGGIISLLKVMNGSMGSVDELGTAKPATGSAFLASNRKSTIIRFFSCLSFCQGVSP